MEEFQNPDLPSEKLYMIDKVVRMRGLQGRFGVDHSEILNYEFEVANKMRSDHMNRLVYKNEYSNTLGNDSFNFQTEGDDILVNKENQHNSGDALSSSILF
jgi:hypothetical protein